MSTLLYELETTAAQRQAVEAQRNVDAAEALAQRQRDALATYLSIIERADEPIAGDADALADVLDVLGLTLADVGADPRAIEEARRLIAHLAEAQRTPATPITIDTLSAAGNQPCEALGLPIEFTPLVDRAAEVETLAIDTAARLEALRQQCPRIAALLPASPEIPTERPHIEDGPLLRGVEALAAALIQSRPSFLADYLRSRGWRQDSLTGMWRRDGEQTDFGDAMKKTIDADLRGIIATGSNTTLDGVGLREICRQRQALNK